MAKKTREKKYVIRKFFLELKRVRWPSAKVSSMAFYKTVIFVILAMGLFFLLTLLSSLIWAELGVGLN